MTYAFSVVIAFPSDMFTCVFLLIALLIYSGFAGVASLGGRKGVAKGRRGPKGCGQDDGSQKGCGA